MSHTGENHDGGHDESLPVRAVEPPPSPARPLVADVVSFGSEPPACTLFPADATERERATNWISAREGSFVTLADWR